MRTIKRIAGLQAMAAVLLLLSASAALAWSFETMPVDQIKPGMKGYGLTAFKGAKPEKFDVEVVAVIKKWASGNDMILIRCSGHNLEQTGVAAGMSGSPIYIDGKLIGALAFAWYWAKEPMAGVQPIGEMLKLWEQPSAGAGGSAGGGASVLGYPGAFEDRIFKIWKTPEIPARSIEPQPLSRVKADAGPYGEVELERIATPLMMSGVSRGMVEFMGKGLAPLGMVPVAGGGGDADASGAPGVDDLAPGSPITSALVTGDFKITAMGTVTAREGDRLLAFGHSFFNEGPAALPLGGGEVYHFMSTLNWTYKMGAPGRVLGSIVDDRVSAIAGKIGAEPDYFPVTVEIADQTTGKNFTFNVRIAQIREIVPYLLMGVVGNALDAAAGYAPEVSVRATIDGAVRGYPRPFHFEDTFASPPDSYDISAMSYVLTLLYNPFEKIQLDSVKVKMTLERKLKDAQIIAVGLGANEFHPGDTVKAYVRMMHFDNEETTLTLDVPIPADAKPGTITIAFEGGGSIFGFPQMTPVQDFDQLFDALANWIPQNSVAVSLVYPEQAIGVEGRELQNLPASVIDQFTGVLDPESKPFSRYRRLIFKTDRVVYGSWKTTVNIEKENE
jgi:hypothetical protein